jgi:hypothetical protein
VSGISAHLGFAYGRAAVEQTTKQEPRYRITWTDFLGGKNTRDFYTRKSAVLSLNSLILDMGIANAKLRLLPRKKVS